MNKASTGVQDQRVDSPLGAMSGVALPTQTLRCCALTAFCGYLAWNIYWVSHGTVPPSIFKSFTGLPCATTGGTRSLLCLLVGDWQESLRYNALTLPICLLFVFSLAYPFRRWTMGQRSSLPSWTVRAWIVTLSVAWILKLAGDPNYW